MIPVIQNISTADAKRYYHGCLVFHCGVPCVLRDVIEGANGNTAVIMLGDGKSVTCPYNDLEVTVLPPFYSEAGQYLGHEASRRAARSIQYPLSSFDDIESMLETGDVPPKSTAFIERINKDLMITPHQHLRVVMYRDEPVGFLRGNTIHVNNEILKERINIICRKQGVNYVCVAGSSEQEA